MMMNTRETAKRVAEDKIKVETEDPNYQGMLDAYDHEQELKKQRLMYIEIEKQRV